MIKKLTWGIIILLVTNVTWAQTKHIRFKQITIDDGLSLSSVYCIFQDSKGFMWFGTEDGLNRYDGKHFRIFRPDPLNPNSLSHKWIDQVYEDKAGILWFGSRGGLTRFNPKTEKFTQFRSGTEDAEQLANDTVICLLENKQQLWVGTLKGLHQINLKSLDVKYFGKQVNKLKGLSSEINSLVNDKQGNIWIGTNAGLYFYDNQKDSFTKIDLAFNKKEIQIRTLVFDEDILWIGTDQGLGSYSISTKRSEQYLITSHSLLPPQQFIEKIFIDSQKRIWIGNINGLYEFKRKEKAFKLYVFAPDVSNSQSINPVKPILEDQYGDIWYGTFGAGLYKIDSDGVISRYKNNPADETSLSYNSIHSMYEDRAGVLWFGTFGAGLSIYDPQSNKFDLMTNNPNNINSLSTNFVWSIMEATDGSVWIGTNSKGISRYFPKTGNFIHYLHNPADKTSLSNPTIRFIYQDSKGNIWIATDGGGLNQYIEKKGKFRHYRHSVTDSTSISNDFVRGIYEDNTGMLWVGTRNGLNKLDPNTGKFKRYFHIPGDKNSLSHNYVYTGIYQDSKGNLWIGTMGGGLNKMDIQKETFTSYVNDPKNPESISDDMVFWIYEDDKGLLWIATNSGLNRFEPKTETFKKFGLNEGLPNEVVYGFLPDDDNNLWLSTNYGISKFSLSDYSTKNFDVNDGLQSNEFNGGAFHLGHSGNMYFGGVYGLNIINPKQLKAQENKMNIVFTKLDVFGQEVQVIDSLDNKNVIIESAGIYYLGESISYTDEIVLDYSNNFFSLEFAALNTPLPGKVQYAYIMENLDKDWNYSGNRNFVSYVRLKPGNYVFKVKAQNSDGLWSPTVAELKITIKPPFWRTWWFILLEIIVAINLILLIYRFLLKTKTNKLLQIQNEQIRLANQQLSESEKNLKELNATKDKFFSIISHDLKNPFTSLLSMSESVSQNFHEYDNDDKQSVFNKLHESHKQIYSLLNNLLTWSRAQSQRIGFEPVEFNLSKLIEININLHRSAAEKKGIKLISKNEDNLKVFADREMINTVLRNLINNAVKFSNKGNIVEIDSVKKGTCIEVLVKDQGVGISVENLQKLFRIDLKYKAEGTAKEKGTGLGLILCREFVEQNKGKINVTSKPGEGSVFSFTIPKSNNN